MVSRIAAGILVLVLLSTAVSAVRGAMQQRRERAERAFLEASTCVLAGLDGPSSARPAALLQCGEMARAAADLSLELPDRGSRQLELRAALDELVHALEGNDGRQLSSAVERATRAGGALGWRVVPSRLH
ncbi:MAG TPA: hypothetical protein VER04_02310 [Polyangiaceae bacterium]|nr:hypothetical protein [Polyangiaceae bacterium]